MESKIDIKDLRVGSILLKSLKSGNGRKRIVKIDKYDLIHILNETGPFNYESVALTEEILVNKCGFSSITESSAGIRYGIVKDHVFSSDLTLTFWKTTENAGKFFRDNMEIDSVHIIQNILWDLAKIEITL